MSGIRSILSDFRDASRARVSGVRVRRGGQGASRIGAVALALVILVSMLAMPLGASVATAQSGPSGMVALGPDQVDEDLPSDADVPIRASDLEGNVYASDHAGTLQITVTTPERASDYMGENANVIADDDIAIVLADDEVHEGRDVAVDLDVLEAGVGYVPDVAYGVHDSGEEWQSPIEQTDGVGRFHVDKFSSNSVTFSGGIELSGSAAADGTNYQYELDNLNGVEDYAINLTGVENTNPDSYAATSNRSTTQTLTVGGNSEPRESNVTVTGVEETEQRNVDGSGSDTLNIGGNQDTETTFSAPGFAFTGSGKDSNDGGESSVSGTASKSYDSYDSDTLVWDVKAYGNEDADFGRDQYTEASYDLYIGETSGSTTLIDSKSNTGSGGSTVSTDGYGTVDTSGWNSLYIKLDWSATADSETFNDPGDAFGEFNVHSAESPALTVTQDTSQTVTDGESVTLSPGSVSIDSTTDWSADWTETTATEDPSVAIDGNTIISHTGVLEPGESVSENTTALSTGENTVEVSSTNSKADWETNWIEVTETSDPVVEVNGYTTEYNGVLSEGETTSLATNEAWLQEGTNNVTVRTNTPSNGPESLVDMTYSHDASGVTKSVDVEATSWTESFNVSHTFPSAVADADATLTFDEQVAEINDVEYRIDGGEWQAPPSYELNGTDLNVALGDVEADTEIDVRATGHKVRAYDGAVKVTEPTVEGDDLSTEVEITDINPDGMFGLRVDETVLGDRLHYASEESWTGESAHASITSSGTQILRAPDANEGSTMRVSTAPVSVSPSSGAIEAEVEDGSEPTFSLRKGNTTGSDRIEVEYYNTVTGDRYVLWSETREVEVDADRAESPVSFITDGSSETYSILQRDAGESGTDGSPRGPTGQEGAFSLILTFAGIGGVLVGSTFVSRRFNIGGWLLPVTATSLTAVAIQVLSPGSPLLRVAQLASESNAVTIGAVAALLIGMWQLDERTQGSVPWYVRGIIGLLSVVWALETISPGVILGGLRSGVESMGPLIVIVIVGGGAYLIREWIQARRAPDTVINAQLGREE